MASDTLPIPVDSIVMLELLEEAGDEPVTLDELGVAGVRDPARALLELELAGHVVQRVIERDRVGETVECVRLARERVPELPTEPLRVPAAAVAAEPSPGATLPRPALIACLLLALLLLAGLRRR